MRQFSPLNGYGMLDDICIHFDGIRRSKYNIEQIECLGLGSPDFGVHLLAKDLQLEQK